MEPQEVAAAALQMSPVTPRDSDTDQAFAVPEGDFLQGSTPQ